MLFCSSNWKDIDRYYRNTWVKLPDTGDELYYISHVTTQEVKATTLSGEQTVIYLSDSHPYDLGYVLPHKSFFQHEEHACQLIRVPAQQYKRGVCSDNTTVAVITSKGGRQSVDLTGDLLKAYVEKQAFKSLDNCLQMRGTLLSTPLSPRFAIGLPTTGTILGYITLDDELVATVNKAGKIVPKYDVFIPELAKFGELV